MGKHIFIVDDEENIRSLIKKYLEKEGFIVHDFDSIESMEKETAIKPDMYILDIMLPGTDGLEFCKMLRTNSKTPIIFVSAKDEELDKILGLELGGDDYLSKPFSPRELIARVKSVFRRVEKIGENADLYKAGDIAIFPNQRKAETSGGILDLTSKEYELLSYLVINKNMAFTRAQLLNKIWGYDYYGDERAVDDLVKRLRKKLSEKGSKAEIITIWGYGYKLNG